VQRAKKALDGVSIDKPDGKYFEDCRELASFKAAQTAYTEEVHDLGGRMILPDCDDNGDDLYPQRSGTTANSQAAQKRGGDTTPTGRGSSYQHRGDPRLKGRGRLYEPAESTFDGSSTVGHAGS
jgi:hypothetical protein